MCVTSSFSRPQPLHRTIRITRDACGMGLLGRDSDNSRGRKRLAPHNAKAQLQSDRLNMRLTSLNALASRQALNRNSSDDLALVCLSDTSGDTLVGLDLRAPPIKLAVLVEAAVIIQSTHGSRIADEIDVGTGRMGDTASITSAGSGTRPRNLARAGPVFMLLRRESAGSCSPSS